MKFVILIFIIGAYACTATTNLPFFVDNGANYKKISISTHQYKKLLRKSIKKSLRDQPQDNSAYSLKWLTLGLGVDKRVGFLDWNISSSLAMEFHLRRIR